MTKIVVGKTATKSDLDSAARLKSSIVHRWLTPIITDDKVTTNMYNKEKLILIGGPDANMITKMSNDENLHYTVDTVNIYDSTGKSLGKFVVLQVKNHVHIWGVHAQNTIDAVSSYIGKEAWKAPVVVTLSILGSIGTYSYIKRKR